MNTYQIKRWDSVVVGNNPFPFPMIYIKPNDLFYDFAKANTNIAFVKITGTGSAYDERAFVGVISTPENRPFFYDKTKLLLVTLYAPWLEYPPRSGSATFSGLKGPFELPPIDFKEAPVPKPVWVVSEGYNGEKCDSGKKGFYPLLIVFIIVFLVMFLSRKK